MEKSCAKCSKIIAGISNQCTGCGVAFHPGCARAHLQSKSARDCCLHNLASAPGCSGLGKSSTTRSRLNLNLKMSSVPGHKYVWTIDGRIYARKADGQPRFEVKSEDDLDHVNVLAK